MNTFLGELATFNDIQYAKYRLAFKLRKLQKTFLFDEVDMNTLQEGLHHSSVEPLPRTAIIPASQLATAVQEIFSALRLHRPMLSSAKLQQAQELCTNWMQMNYQCATGGKVQVGSLKITLCLLTGAKEAEKARHMFSILANSNGSVEAADLTYFCNIAQHLARTLQEDLFANWDGPQRFWKECLLSVRSAADIADEEIDGGIRRQWLSQFEFVKAFTSQPEPLFLSWWLLFHHIKNMGKVIHSVRCSACTRKPIVSYRYQCTECSNFNLCQMCFLKGRLAGTHKNTHGVVEIRMPSKSQKSWKHRLLGVSEHDGHIWKEPKSPFVFNPRTSVSSLGSSGDHTDNSMSAITDMLVNSQQQKSAVSHHTHKPTMIRIGSQPIIRNQPIISSSMQPVPLPSHDQLKRSSLSTNSSSGSPDSVSSSGGKFNYEGARVGVPNGHSRTTSSCSSNDALSLGTDTEKLGHPPAKQNRSQSATSPMTTPTPEDELSEINQRLSMEVDLLLNDLVSSTEEISSPSVKPTISPVSFMSHHRRGHSVQHLRIEERALEKDVSTLTDKRDELTVELESLISQVQSLHTHSVSLSNGIKVTPSIGISPLVGPTHTRSDSLPAEAYLGGSSQSSLGHSTTSPIPRLSPSSSHTSIGHGQSPLIHRKISPASQQMTSNCYQKQQLEPANLICSMTSPILPDFDGTMRADSASPVQYLAPAGIYSSMDHINNTLTESRGRGLPPRPLSANYQQQPLQKHMITEF